MQEKVEFWQTFGPILVALFMFGFIYAILVRWLSKKKVRGQTAYSVVFGVAVTVIAMGPVIGWANVFCMLIGFAASGFWMILEDVQRAWLEDEADRKEAERMAKDLLK
jgi:hypothetical protein